MYYTLVIFYEITNNFLQYHNAKLVSPDGSNVQIKLFIPDLLKSHSKVPHGTGTSMLILNNICMEQKLELVSHDVTERTVSGQNMQANSYILKK